MLRKQKISTGLIGHFFTLPFLTCLHGIISILAMVTTIDLIGLPSPYLPYLSLPYPTLPYPTLPYLTFPYPTLPYPTLPLLTLPFFTCLHGIMQRITLLISILAMVTSIFTSLWGPVVL